MVKDPGETLEGAREPAVGPPPPLPPAVYVVATPIGNLDDITVRALDVLRRADLVACEDTRHSAPVLNLARAVGRRLAFHDHNEDEVAAQLVAEVQAGRSVALICDAGTPLISDPGFPLVRLAAEAGVRVVPLPGACAAVAALSVSGLSPARFHFVGFLPERVSRRSSLLASLRALEATLVFYVPARELRDALGQMADGLGDRPAAVCRELTKLHEEVARGTLRSLSAAGIAPLGEAVVVVDGAPPAQADPQALDDDIRAGLKAGEQPSALARRLAGVHGLGRRPIYDRILALKGT